MPNQAVAIINSALESLAGFGLRIGSISMSPITIERIALRGYDGKFSYAGGELRNASMRARIEVSIRWRVRSICVDLLVDEICTPSGGGTVKILDYTSPFMQMGNLPIKPGSLDIVIPELSLRFQADSINVPEKRSDPPVSAEEAVMREVTVENTELQQSTPALLGGVKMTVKGPSGKTNMATRNTKIKDCTVAAISLPEFSLTNLRISNLRINRAEAGGFEATGTVSRDSSTISVLGFVELSVTAKVTTTIRAGGLIMNNLNGGMTADTASMSGARLNIKIGDIAINSTMLSNCTYEKTELVP
jgi:hypothetical protein